MATVGVPLLTSDNIFNPPPPPPPTQPNSSAVPPTHPFNYFSPSPPNFDQISPINVPTPIKLTQTNFLIWKAQILPIINGYNLIKFLNSPPPPPTRQTIDGQLEFNHDFLPWNRQDQLMLGWLRASLSEPIQAQFVSCTSSAALWTSIQQQFATNSRARLLDLKRQLQSATKGSASCTEFLLQIRQIADELASIGAPPTEDDLVLTLINGLGSDYNAFVAAITATSRNEVLSLSDIHGMLLSHEALIKSQAASASSLPTAFYSNRPSSGFNPT